MVLSCDQKPWGGIVCRLREHTRKITGLTSKFDENEKWKKIENERKSKENLKYLYVSHFFDVAHIKVVVAFLVVNFFGFLIITRHHGVGQVPGVVEMNPTSFPELFKPSRDLRNLQKSKFLGVNIFRKIRKNPFKVLYITF